MVSETIGLLPGFGWIVDGPFWLVAVKLLMITPIGFILVGVIGEGRLVPLDGARQFKSFFPGDIFLGIATAFMVFAAGFVPASDRWYTSTLFHVAVIAVTFIVAVVMTYMEYADRV